MARLARNSQRRTVRGLTGKARASFVCQREPYKDSPISRSSAGVINRFPGTRCSIGIELNDVLIGIVPVDLRIIDGPADRGQGDWAESIPAPGVFQRAAIVESGSRSLFRMNGEAGRSRKNFDRWQHIAFPSNAADTHVKSNAATVSAID